MTHTILVTGFGPFPGVAYNPSGAAAKAIDGERVGQVAFVGRQVPVSWARAWPAIRAAVDEVAPVALVMLGVAVARQQICVERVARNVRSQRADCDGAYPTACLDGPAELPSTLPWEALCAEGVIPWDDAGSYLCNEVFYRAAAELPQVPYRGFIHIPQGPIEPVLDLLRRLASVTEAHLEPAP